MLGFGALWFGAFFLGSLPFSVWASRLLGGADIRTIGDGNPGATNAFAAGGLRAGLPALMLDYGKGALPTAGFHFVLDITGLSLAALALAPVLGHAFSPFLGGRGGKALATTFGTWTGLTLGEAPLVLGLLLSIFKWARFADGWALALGWAGLGVHLLVARPDPALGWPWGANGLLLLWKYRRSFASWPLPNRIPYTNKDTQ